MEKPKRINDVKVLPFDAWFEILRRIPAVDLVPPKAVCKTFRRLISSDFFARIHLDDFIKAKRAMIITVPSPTDNPKLFHSNFYDPDKRTISVWRDEPRFDDLCSHEFPHTHSHRVIDSYRGILLVLICNRLLLCNPITRSHEFLPSLQPNSGCWKIAYDDVLKQYKVFGLRKRKKDFSLYVFDVYREGELHPPRKTKVLTLEEDFHEKESVLVNGSVYWLIIPIWGNYATYIVSVNVTTEEVKTRSCFFEPLIVTHNREQIGNFQTNCDFQLWVLEGLESENPNPSWMIKHRIENLGLSSILRFMHWYALRVFRDKMLIMVRRSRANELYQYDLGNEEFEKVTLVRDDNNERGVVSFVNFRIVEHIDSLLSWGPIDDKVWV